MTMEMEKGQMNSSHDKEKELYEYIKNRTYPCMICYELQQEIIENDIKILASYDGMICGGVEDMLTRFSKLGLKD